MIMVFLFFDDFDFLNDFFLVSFLEYKLSLIVSSSIYSILFLPLLGFNNFVFIFFNGLLRSKTIRDISLLNEPNLTFFTIPLFGGNEKSSEKLIFAKSTTNLLGFFKENTSYLIGLSLSNITLTPSEMFIILSFDISDNSADNKFDVLKTIKNDTKILNIFL